jgi:hypothetical protein
MRFQDKAVFSSNIGASEPRIFSVPGTPPESTPRLFSFEAVHCQSAVAGGCLACKCSDPKSVTPARHGALACDQYTRRPVGPLDLRAAGPQQRGGWHGSWCPERPPRPCRPRPWAGTSRRPEPVVGLTSRVPPRCRPPRVSMIASRTRHLP